MVVNTFMARVVEYVYGDLGCQGEIELDWRYEFIKVYDTNDELLFDITCGDVPFIDFCVDSTTLAEKLIREFGLTVGDDCW